MSALWVTIRGSLCLLIAWLLAGCRIGVRVDDEGHGMRGDVRRVPADLAWVEWREDPVVVAQ
jgi:hypothetical protein